MKLEESNSAKYVGDDVVLFQWLQERLLQYHGPVVIDQGVSLSGREVLNLVNECTNDLASCASRVVLLKETSSIHFLVLFIALIRARAIITPISPATHPQAERKIGAALSAAYVAQWNRRENSICLSPLNEAPDYTNILPEELSEGPGFIRFTSGTTGTAKGVCISKAAALVRAKSCAQGLTLQNGDVALWMLPMEHHFISALLGMIEAGVTIAFRTQDEAQMTKTYEQTSVLYAAPPDIRLLLSQQEHISLPNLRVAVCTAGPIQDHECEAFSQAFHTRLCRVFGAIEVGLGLGTVEQASMHSGSLGYPFPGYNVRITEEGRLSFRSEGLFSGYASPRYEKSDEAGWFITSDMAARLDDDSFKLLGRADTVINVGGYKVFPEEVEEVLMSHPLVIECLTRGTPHPLLGEVIMADIRIHKGDSSPKSIERELRIYCRQHLENYKVPQVIRQVSHFKKTRTGKICRSISLA